MLRILIVGLVVLVVAMMLINRQGSRVPEPAIATVLPEPRDLPDIELVDKAGDPYRTSDLAGEYTLLFFGFTNCPDICPITLSVLADVSADLQSRQRALAPRVAFVSVDPHRDTPQAIAAYLDHFDSGFLGLTAPDATLAPLLETLGVTVHKNDIGGERYNVVHNGTIFVLDRDARWIALFGGSEHDAGAIATDFLRIRLRHEAGVANTEPPEPEPPRRQTEEPAVIRVAAE